MATQVRTLMFEEEGKISKITIQKIGHRVVMVSGGFKKVAGKRIDVLDEMRKAGVL